MQFLDQMFALEIVSDQICDAWAEKLQSNLSRNNKKKCWL